MKSHKNKKIYIITFGCSLNFSDSEVMAGLLEKQGFKIVKASIPDDGIKKADLVIVNSCTVKNTTEINFNRLLRNLNSKNKKIVIAGCIPQTDSEKLEKYSLVGTTQLNKIVGVVEETMAGHIVKFLERSKTNPRLNLPKIRKNSLVEIIPISQGCLGNCSYCKTKAARFDLLSYDNKAIICQAKAAIKQGVKEIWLTSQDNAVYGYDLSKGKNNKKLTLIDLLKDLIKIPGKFKIRIGMGNPEHFAEIIDELLLLFNSKPGSKLFKFLHIPVQSGNNTILKAMNRKYKVSDYKKLIKKIKQEQPNMTISTDIIVGFPGETKKQFMDSIKLIKELKPNVLNISRYSARPKTLAALMPQVYGGKTKDRSRLLTNEFYKIAEQNNKAWLDWKGEIIIDEIGKKGTNTLIGRNLSYKPVIIKKIFKGKKIKLGSIIKVKIVSITKNYLLGEVIKI
ncbi:tRNA (N(6)-L-threonylcarbamoyladenosine(37)-C(2))-methylthiotransferase [Candidatus Woesearchaeota archaeon]|jgi:threonylcarbamoyladenosine tRNA methylthiotransferase CDKAL1|nr:tRNA (N(6)-L-threonylcarbamoyladenosine(37)-C(2))-methylthiotransferase [Candidatus Woesearchaeota archaeon]MBT5273180.1 tRNA (N(6)-L-threonylcarbamoyladenosine(37)-C(2))-methylthiotransferase [Candidatus Woesearchaeota archaeon]MBT6041207.1 tRNA (N(6)-L-threonylcarbamoyladenosine(37)-C(2))-methylthiotransferase [Candidatus Woesearchaeota archaeon]MBT6337505.1 tRNA (N(6)-L-threonylcarbamoyladenosine(37)-C(2))-methylthiotransferase [Candidatus Woesearchaeota archaeon]MBT7927094.1 tRNA (N(6)-L